MSISSISASSGSAGYSASDTAATIASLEKQLQSLVKQVTAETNSKDDAKTKELALQQLQLQIENINMRIE